MYRVVGNARSRAIRVYWMLEEIGAPYEVIHAAPRSKEISELNPSGKVPALIFEEQAIIDSVAIIQFLADKHDAFTHRAGTIERAMQDSFTQFSCDEMDGILWAASKHKFVYPPEYRVPETHEGAKWDFARAMMVLEKRLGGNEFVMGAEFTVPDLLLGHCAGWAMAMKFDLPEGKLGDYFKRVRSRPALKRAMAKASAAA